MMVGIVLLVEARQLVMLMEQAMGLMGMARQVFLQLGLAVAEQLELVWLQELVIMEEQLMLGVLGELLVVPKEQAMVLARQV